MGGIFDDRQSELSVGPCIVGSRGTGAGPNSHIWR